MYEVLTSKILKDLIDTDRVSDEKEFMTDGIDYYIGKNDIKGYDFRKFYIDTTEYTDLNKANTSIANNYHKKLVDQKRGYVAGKPITISVKEGTDEKYLDYIDAELGKYRQDTFMEWIKGSCNKGYENLHPYVDENGEFKYTVISAKETIYITDTSLEQKVLNVIRYYNLEDISEDGEITEILRVEVWDSEKVTYYQGDADGNLSLLQDGEVSDVPVNPRYHWTLTDSADGIAQGAGWGRVPFIKLQNNSEETTDLQPIKDYVDAVDLVSSGFINDLKDIQLAIWVLRGYESEDLGEFMLNLQKFKAIKLANDGTSSAEPKTMEIPKEARVAILSWLEEKIYQIGQGVNEATLASGNITNVVIKAHYTGLDIKANTLIIKMTKAMYEFLWFTTAYINDTYNTAYEVDDLIITFNKSMIFNELEIVDMCTKSKGMISDETIMANHPWVDDVEKEKELMEAELEAKMDAMGFDPDNLVEDNNIDDEDDNTEE